jgi:DNA recombination protein RmuC
MQSIETQDLVIAVAVLGGMLLLGLLLGLLHFYRSNRELQSALEAQRRNESELLEILNTAEKDGDRLRYELEGERARLRDREQQFDASRKQLKLEFENLANKIFDDKTRAFDRSSKDSISALLKPFRDQVESFQKRVNDVHSESVKGNAALEAEIRKVLEIGLKMGADAQNLTNALKGESQRRGSWGETQLEKTLQMSGLIEHDHYEKQTSLIDDEGRRKQTDFLIKLPDSKHIVIDSKVSLAAYDRAVAAENDDQLNLALADHVKAVKTHILDLQSKDYSNLIGIRSPSFVLMFMPIEPAYIEALKYEKDLFAFGYERGVVLVSHTTLIPILRTVANLWAMERSTREARELGDKAGDIYNQVRKVAERLDKLGGSLRAANNHYNATVRSISGRQGLSGKVERFGELSSKVTRAIPEIEPIHSDLQHEALELVADPIIEEVEQSAEEESAPETLRAT